MTRYTAFLRAINVGGHHKIKMADLRDQLEAIDLQNVATLIASGNVVFDAPESDPATLEQRIEAQLAEANGFEVPTFVRTAEEVVALATADPFGPEANHDDATVYVGFLRPAPDPEQIAALMALQNPVDTFHMNGPHVYWLRRRDRGESVIDNARLEKMLGVEATLRNMNTLRKLVDRFLVDGEATA